jgi:hypothetical protein
VLHPAERVANDLGQHLEKPSHPRGVGCDHCALA